MTVADPDTDESATEVAVTDTKAGLGAVEGAVYFPVESIVPQLAPIHPLPETFQETTGTVPKGSPDAMNCWTPLMGTVAVAGETAMPVGAGVTKTTAVAVLLGSATDVATMYGPGASWTVDGAVYFPVASIVPHPAPVQLLPGLGNAAQVTPLFIGSFRTVAVN